MEPKMRRWVGWLGIAFVVVFVVSSFTAPNSPNTKKSATNVIHFYQDHRSAVAVDAWIIMLAIVIGVFFFWWLREYLANTDTNRRLATIGFAGALLFAVSGGLSAGLNFVLADAVNHKNSQGVVQTLNVLQNGFTVFIAGAGVALFLITTGIVCLKGAALPKWLGWVALVLTLASLAVPFLSPPAAGLWVLIASIVILVRERQPRTATAA